LPASLLLGRQEIDGRFLQANGTFFLGHIGIIDGIDYYVNVNSYLHSSNGWLVHSVILVFVFAPVPEHFWSRKLRQSCSHWQRMGYYAWIVGLLWASTVVAISAIGVDGIANAGGLLDLGAQAVANPWVHIPLLALVSLLILVCLLPSLMLPFKPKVRDAYSRAAGKLPFGFLFPRSPLEQWMFALVSISAGICEETLFRSFFVSYLGSGFGLNLWLAFSLSTLAFGLNHEYQGYLGIIRSGILGAVLGLLFFLTRSLALCMVIHAVLDLQVLLLLRPDWHTRANPEPKAA